MIGTTLGPYEVLARLGEGGMGCFTSERDGFRCLYASRFDPGDVAGSRLVFSMQEVAGNIWSLTPK